MARVERSSTLRDSTKHDESNCSACQRDIAAMTSAPVDISAEAVEALDHMRHCVKSGADLDMGLESAQHVIHAFDALRTALTAAESQREWQPIETAPKDRPVLVSGLMADDEGRWVVLAVQKEGTWFRCYLDGRTNWAEVMPPSHWTEAPKEPS